MLYYKIYSDEKDQISHQKPVIVFIHGFACTMGIFAKQIKPLKKHYDLVLVDLPSHGRTEQKLSDSEISFSAISYEIIQILDELKVEKAHFIGCSLGVMFVKYFLTYFSERVDKSVLIGGMGAYMSYYNTAINIGKFLLHFLPRQICCEIVATIIMPSKISKDVRKLLFASIKRISKKEFYAWLTLVTRFPKLNQHFIKRVYNNQIDKDKIMYISGDKDLIFLPTVRQEMAIFRNAYILNNCGHICNFDQAEETNDLIKMFLIK